MVLKQSSFSFAVYLFSVQLLPIEIKCLISRCLYFRPADGIRDVMRLDRSLYHLILTEQVLGLVVRVYSETVAKLHLHFIIKSWILRNKSVYCDFCMYVP